MHASRVSARVPPSILLRYSLASGAAILALLLTLLMRPILHEPLFSLFYVAVLVSSWYGGLGPGLLATALSILLADYYVFPPMGILVFDVDTFIRLSIEVFTALLISSLTASRSQLATTLRAQREQLQVTLASIGDAVITTDDHGQVTFLNPVAESLTGWSLTTAAGRAITEIFPIVHADTRQPVENPVRRVLREGVIAGLANHTLLIAQDGTERPIDDSGAPIKDVTGQIIGVVLVFRDVTARLQAEAALQASRDQLAVILQGIADGVVAEAPNGRLLYANEAATKVIGYPSVDVMLEGASAERLQRFTIMDEAGQPLPTSQLPGRLVFQGADHAARVVRYRVLATGQERWAMVQARPVRNPAGQVVMAIAVMHDITVQKRSEAERAELLAREQAARVAADAAKRQATFLADASQILAASMDYSTTLSNVAQLAVPALADWCGIYLLNEQQDIVLLAVAHSDPAKVRLGYELFHHYPPSFTAPSGVGAVLRTGQAEINTEIADAMLVAVARDPAHLALLRTIGFCSIMIVPLIARGRTLAALTFVSSQPEHLYGPDDLRFAEELALRAAQAIDNAQLYQATQQAVQLREHFLSLAAHELKTPLTSLTGQVQLFQRRAEREQQLNERDQRTLGIIHGQVARLNKMVLALLDISRLEMGQLTIEQAPVDLCALVRRVLDEIAPTVEDRRIECAAPIGPIVVQGDAVRLEQVVQNLVQNALKYSQPPTVITVTITVQIDHACVAVADQGIGIPTAALPRLFQRFYRAGNVEEQHMSGLGIGLYVVREIVTLHGGTVTVDSIEGSGSTFTVCLPYDASMEGRGEA